MQRYTTWVKIIVFLYGWLMYLYGVNGGGDGGGGDDEGSDGGDDGVDDDIVLP